MSSQQYKEGVLAIDNDINRPLCSQRQKSYCIMENTYRRYIEARATQTMRNLPRFGHTSNFAMLWGNEDEKSDYIYGLLFGGIFIIAFFIVWTILVPIFKCLGQRKVGFLSGSPFQVHRGSKKPRIIRSAFIIASIFMLIFSVLLVTKGLTQIETGVNAVYSSSVAFDEIIDKAEKQVDALTTWVENAIPLRDELVSQLTDFCQGTNLTAETGTEFDAITQNVTSSLNDLGNFSQDDVEELKYGLINASESSSNAMATTEKITLDSWESLIFIIPFSIFFVALVAGVLLAWFDRWNKRFSFFLSWIILPLFFILIIVSYVLAGGIAMSASANADFCSGGTDSTPQGSLFEIVNMSGYSEDDIEVRALKLYVQQCRADDPFGFLHVLRDALNATNTSIAELNATITNVTIESLSDVCSGEDVQLIQNLLVAMGANVETLASAANTTLRLLACEYVSLLFTNAFWDGTCTYSVEGVTWAFSSFLVIGMMGMLMIMFRSAWLPTQYVDDEKVIVPTVECAEEFEVEYAPYEAEQPLEDGQKASALEEAPMTGVGVVTGVTTEAAVDEACPAIENGDEDAVAVVTGVATEAAVDEACPTIENGDEDAVAVVTGKAAGAAVDEACPPIENGGEDDVFVA